MAAVLVTLKKEARLLDELQKISQDIKALEDSFALKRKELEASTSYSFDEEGTFMTKTGAILTITERKGNNIPPDPKATHELLKSEKKGNFFYDVIKVDVTALLKVITPKKGFIKRKASTIAWSFSKS